LRIDNGMTELTPVDISAPTLAPAGDRPVIFHGVNKTGSLAMSNVLREAYLAADRADQFFSVYHHAPSDFDQLSRAIQSASSHGFFVSHYIYRRISLPRDALLVSQIRHPLPRTLSVYGWSKGTYLHRHGSLDGFPPLSDWVLRTKGTHHTQMAQFAIGFPADVRAQTAKMPPQDMCALALDNLHNDFAWFGCAELFEESIFAMAHLCSLNAVPAWEKDTRNRWRESIQDSDEDTLGLISDVMAYEFEFYERALASLRARLSGMDLGSSIAGYRARCRTEYGERLVAP
jgi:hypothetical protein